jgi:hypothetical protein
LPPPHSTQGSFVHQPIHGHVLDDDLIALKRWVDEFFVLVHDLADADTAGIHSTFLHAERFHDNGEQQVQLTRIAARTAPAPGRLAPWAHNNGPCPAGSAP